MTRIKAEMDPVDVRLAPFDFNLPEDQVARFPPEQRDGGRLLCSAEGGWATQTIPDLLGHFESGDVLVVNDTRVLSARMFGLRETGGRVELLLLGATGTGMSALVRPSKKIRVGERLELLLTDGNPSGHSVVVGGSAEDGRRMIELSCPAEELMNDCGALPLPPYLNRPAEASDSERYQTVFADRPGAVAAPTASLHLTDLMIQSLVGKGVQIHKVTLHVGPGTFRNLRPVDLDSGRLHTERYSIGSGTAEAVNCALAEGRRVTAVGTTVTRTLESAVTADGTVAAGDSTTDLFIRPGHRFRAVNRLMTNFHLPKSSLLMLVCAFGGREHVLSGYAEAVRAGFRFYSYGDAMLLEAATGDS
jgi:S-adenosylmethionine:tRNA ribosyltransferase-isomerase